MNFDIRRAYMTKAETSMISIRMIICEAQAYIRTFSSLAASIDTEKRMRK